MLPQLISFSFVANLTWSSAPQPLPVPDEENIGSGAIRVSHLRQSLYSSYLIIGKLYFDECDVIQTNSIYIQTHKLLVGGSHSRIRLPGPTAVWGFWMWSNLSKLLHSFSSLPLDLCVTRMVSVSFTNTNRPWENYDTQCSWAQG